ncbi:MAG: acyltransferase domain-containing protein [Deltaproteobacteria bacterium]|nr:acyltransferase domain-containing protein [Deltaproteobacteria bacterium]
MVAQPEQDIAVVGVSALFPGSDHSAGFWRDILLGKNLVTEVPESHWNLADYYDESGLNSLDKTWGKVGGFLSDIPFDPLEWGIPPHSLEATDSSQLLALIVAGKLIDDFSAVRKQTFDRRKTSVILGVTAAQQLFSTMAARMQRPVWEKALRSFGLPEEQLQLACDRIAAEFPAWQENTFPGLLGNVVAGRIANRLNLGGANFVTDAACASALAALSMAVAELRSGHSDLVLTGGADTMNDIMMYMCFTKTPALSRSGCCRPFDRDADGTVLGEGIGMLALRRLEDAEAQSDHIYALIRGIGQASDGRVRSIYAPWAEGQSTALRRAYEQAGFGAETVGMIEAHGTGTRAGDAAELESLHQVFPSSEDGQPYCALGSVKSQIGHTKAAAGAAGLFRAVMALHHQVLPPTLHVDHPASQLAEAGTPFYLNHIARPWLRLAGDPPRRSAVSSFGFGGSDFHVVLEEYRGKSGKLAPRKRAWPCELFVWSAETKEELFDEIRHTIDALSEYRDESFAWWARESQQAFYSGNAVRLAVVAEDFADLKQKLTRLKERESRSQGRLASLAEWGLHLGEGSSPGLLCFLYPGQESATFYAGSAFAGCLPGFLETWQSILNQAGDTGRTLAGLMMPPSVYSGYEQTRQEEFRKSCWAQPSVTLLNLVINETLAKMGLRGNCFIGHAAGELAALHGAGALSAGDSLELALAWGRAFPENGAHVSGFSDEEHMAAFCHAIRDISFSAPRGDVISAHFAAPYPEKSSDISEFLSALPGGAARFASQLHVAWQKGCRTFVEMGPGHALRDLTQRILKGMPHQTFAVGCGAAQEIGELLNLLAFLAGQGHSLCFDALWEGYESLAAVRKPDHAVMMINGSNQHIRAQKTELPQQKSGDVTEVRTESSQKEPCVTMDKKAQISRNESSTAASLEQMFRVLSESQKQIAQAHEAYQKSMSESHQLYLRSSGEGLKQIAQILSDHLPSEVESPGQSLMTEAPMDVRESSHQPSAPDRGDFVSFSGLRQGAESVASPSSSGINFSGRNQISGMTSELSDSSFLLSSQEARSVSDAVHKAVASDKSAAQHEPLPAKRAVKRSEHDFLQIIADKTGYPVEMLNLSMSMEGDLGIDSIKQVEIFSALSGLDEGADGRQPENLGQMETLQDVMEWWQEDVCPSEEHPANVAPGGDSASRAGGVTVTASPESLLTGAPSSSEDAKKKEFISLQGREMTFMKHPAL